MHAILEALPEPSLVVDTGARILLANRATMLRFGHSLDGRTLTALAADGAEAGLRTYLIRCSGSRGSLPGAVMLRGTNGRAARFRCTGSLLTPRSDETPALVFLRLSETRDERFSALARKVEDLNAEIRARRRTQAILEEALKDRELMLRELHHRVKNSIQMLVGMVAAARREASAPTARAVLDEAARRLAAVGAVHQMLYRTDSLESLRGDRFVAELSVSILRAFGGQAQLSIDGTTGVAIPNDAAVPLALILNELLTNALKHGPSDGRINVGLCCAGDVFELSVVDDGPGFDPAGPAKRASGLGLVRGLVRQLGGCFTVERADGRGARCIVRFENRRLNPAEGSE